MSDKITYRESGVDIDEGERFVRAISPMVKSTFTEGVLTGLGHFGALFELDLERYSRPVLVSGTDGVGTKLKIAFLCDRHDTVGIDLVAMCVNDIITLGADPLFFLDYFATGKLSAEKASEVVKGIVQGCKEAGCALVGGETAEMPGFYREGEYDLSGFAVGIVNRDEIIDGSSIREGDIIIGVGSGGIHSNGYSLVRKVFFEINNYTPDTYMEEIGRTLGEELLEPTKIYVRAVKALKERDIPLKGLAHITGGGIPGNLPRILPEGVCAVINERGWQEPPIFNIIRRLGGIDQEEMRRVFNLGIGFIIIISKEYLDVVKKILEENGYMSYNIGVIEKGERGVRYVQD
ncbi:MAG TPA: phosphoribosylformylglycinamidine cyclo-ligase [Nitrospirae bacterium]|nr:phosphoribosylformylglycinamidine cyclo-ligase [Nitrospirota bacterium]